VAYILKITLENTHPPVWRRVCVPEGITFYDLHRTIQLAFGWEDGHLHEFSFADRSVLIGAEEEDGDVDVVPEHKAVIDEFLTTEKWIRYIYDFGDDWTHKIVLEKTDTKWKQRYPVLMKAKGDHFAEDCGGVWDAGAADRIPVDIDGINACYCTWNLKKGKNGQAAQYALWQLADTSMRKNTRGKINELLARIARESQFEKEYAKQLEMAENLKKIPDKATCNILAPDKTMQEILAGYAPEMMRDMCDFMAIGDPDADEPDTNAARLLEYISAAPQEVLIAFEKEDIHDLKKLYQVPAGRSIEVENTRAVYNAKTLGLLEFNLTAQDAKVGALATIRWAKDAGAFLDRLDDKTIDDYKNIINPILDHIVDLVKVYGMIEYDSLYPLYQKTFSEEPDKRLFKRCLHSMDDPDSLLRMIETYDGKVYVCDDSLCLERILGDIAAFRTEELPYRIYDKKSVNDAWKLIRWKNNAYREFRTYLTESYECPADETDSWCELIYQSVQEGKCPDEIYLELLDGFEVDSVLGRSSMWQAVMGVSLDSPLAALHGYTRQEYASEKKINVASLFRKFDAADDSPDDSKEVQLIADTIFDLSYEEQCTLYFAATDRTQEKDAIKWAENIINALPAKNYDARSELGMIYINRQRYTEAEQLYKQLAAESDDESIAALYREMKKFRRLYDRQFMRDGIFVADEEELGGFLPDENAHVTVRRETPKIGRNDPCPCGSGKKYKKCCMNKK
jgi:hypothetical protein